MSTEQDIKKLFAPERFARLAKEHGFDEPCIALYKPTMNWYKERTGIEIELQPTMSVNSFKEVFNSKLKTGYIAAPLYQQLIDWFRDNGIKIFESEMFINYKGEIWYAKSAGSYKRECQSLDEALEKGFELLKKNGSMKKFEDGGISHDSDSPKIYVADLAAYNEGHLEGEWLDLADYSDGAEVMAAITELVDKWKAKDESHEEYAIHDHENIPESLYSENMGEKDFDHVIELYKMATDRDVPMDVIQSWADDRGAEVSSFSDAYHGKYRSKEDFAESLVDEGVISAEGIGSNIYITDTDRRLLAGEESDAKIEGMDDEDIIKDAGLSEELDALEEKNGRKEETENSEDEDDAAEKAELESFDFDEEKEKLVEKGKEKLQSEYYDSIYESLDDPIRYFVHDQGMYTEEDLLKANFIRTDYEGLAKELEQDYDFIEHDGEVYVFSNNYKKGGCISKYKDGTVLDGVEDKANDKEISDEDFGKWLEQKHERLYHGLKSGGIDTPKEMRSYFKTVFAAGGKINSKNPFVKFDGLLSAKHRLEKQRLRAVNAGNWAEVDNLDNEIKANNSASDRAIDEMRDMEFAEQEKQTKEKYGINSRDISNGAKEYLVRYLAEYDALSDERKQKWPGLVKQVLAEKKFSPDETAAREEFLKIVEEKKEPEKKDDAVRDRYMIIYDPADESKGARLYGSDSPISDVLVRKAKKMVKDKEAKNAMVVDTDEGKTIWSSSRAYKDLKFSDGGAVKKEINTDNVPDNVYQALYDIDRRLVDTEIKIKKESKGAYVLTVQHNNHDLSWTITDKSDSDNEQIIFDYLKVKKYSDGGQTPIQDVIIAQSLSTTQKQDLIIDNANPPVMAKGGKTNGDAYTKHDIDEILKQYVGTALWSSTDDDEDNTPLDSDHNYEDVDEKTLKLMRADIEKFVKENKKLLEESGLDDEQIGHDLWLTRNGHGAGFWDRGLGKVGDELTAAAKKMKERNIYAQDGKIYQEQDYSKGGKAKKKRKPAAKQPSKKAKRNDLLKKMRESVGN